MRRPRSSCWPTTPRCRPGEWVLVMGAAGGLGSAGMQVAKHLGAKVIAAAGGDDRVKIGLDLGADAGMNYRAKDLTIEAMRITEGKGVNVVFENIGDPDDVSEGVRGDRAAWPSGHRRRPRRRHCTARRQPALSESAHDDGRHRRNTRRTRHELEAAAEGKFKALIDKRHAAFAGGAGA